MTTNENAPFFIDVEDDELSSPDYSVRSVTEPTELRTPSSVSAASPSEGSTVPIPGREINPNPITQFDILAREMRTSARLMQDLLKEMMVQSQNQHKQTTTVLLAALSNNSSSSQSASTRLGHSREPDKNIRAKRPIDVSDPSFSADPKSNNNSSTKNADEFAQFGLGPDAQPLDENKTATKNPLQKSAKASRKFALDSESESEEGSTNTSATQPDAKEDKSSPKISGLRQFDVLASERKAILVNAANRYEHVSTVYAPIDDSKFTITQNSVTAVIKWIDNLLKYAHAGGNKFYCDLISKNIVEAIQRKNGITREAFYNLSNQDTIDHLFALVRPASSLEWTRLFKNNLQYPTGYSATFLHNQTVLMKFNDLATFVDSTVDLVYVLGPASSPPDKEVRKTFDHMLPATIREMVRDYSIDASLSFLKFLASLKDSIAGSIEVVRKAAPLTQHLQSPTSHSGFRANVMRAPLPEMSDPHHVLFRNDRQVRQSTADQRIRFNALTIDESSGGDNINPEDNQEPAMSAYESQLLQEHGIFTYVAPPPTPAQRTVTPAKYAALKKEMDYPPHLRFPEGPRPCWTYYNSGACPNPGQCSFEHDDKRIEQHIDIKRQREAFLPSKPTK